MRLWVLFRLPRYNKPGMQDVSDRGPCPAATAKEYDGVNDGQNGGRFCWAISGTLCDGDVQGTYAKKFLSCLSCHVFTQMQEEEHRHFVLLPTKK